MKMAEKHRVVIDPGHGGRDSGAIGEFAICLDENNIRTIYEKEVNLGIALYVEDYLSRLCRDKIDVFLTRGSDRTVSLKTRAEIVRLRHPVDLFVSVHCNSFDEVVDTEPGVTGIETFYYWDDARIISYIMQRNLMKAFSECKNRGSKRARYYVLRKGIPESILVECEFIDEIPTWLDSSTVQKKFGTVIGESIREYFLV